MVRSRSVLLAPVLVTLVACTNSGLHDAAPLLEPSGDVIEGEIIIGADVPVDLQDELGLSQLEWHGGLQAGLYLADEGTDLFTVQTALKDQLRGDLLVEPNRPRTLSARSNDPYRDLQWNLDLLDMDAAHDLSTGAGVTVAVIDTGVSSMGEDTPVNYLAGFDFVDDDNTPEDPNGHGTHVAGTVAQATDNGRGVAGVAPDADLLAVRVLNAFGSGSSFDTAQAVYWAVDNGADVINMSLGASFSTGVEGDAIAYAEANGVVVVAASGNAGRNSLDYPAAYGSTIAVGAVRYDGSVAGYSNGGTGLDVVAPGGDTAIDQNGDGYADGVLQETPQGYEFFQGTSMAAPHVAGIAALLLSAGAHPDEIRDLLVSTADNDRWQTRSGWGLVDPVAALESIGATPGTGGGTTDPGAGEDTTPPAISAVSGERSGSSLTLAWTTDEPATTVLDFEVYGEFTTGGPRTTEHEMSFTIDPNETYRFTVVAEDAAGNVAEDGTWISSP